MSGDGLSCIPEVHSTRRNTITAAASSSDYGAPLISKNPGNLGNTIRKAHIGAHRFQRTLGAQHPQRAQFARMSTALNATKDGEEPEVDPEVTAETEVTVVEEKPKEEEKVGLYSWFVLAVLVAIRVIYQWQRSIFSYSYGYKGIGA